MAHETTRGRRRVLFLCVILALIAITTNLSWSFSQGPNNRNVSVDTFVNITGSAPEILNVIVQNPITLGANSDVLVTCNVSIRDYNGFADINRTRAALFNYSSSFIAADDNNTHYTNNSCAPIGGQESGAYANYTCTFAIRYYAVNGTWNCTAVVNDTIGLATNVSNLTNISALLALNVTTLIDYGQMNIGDTSANRTANVTNVGNVPINVSVAGYGRLWNDGWGLVCEQGNITVARQRFAANISANYTDKQALSGTRQQVFGLTVPKTLDNAGTVNTTYWQLRLDPSENAFGICNGTIVFQAETV